jgi:hypothetical protein
MNFLPKLIGAGRKVNVTSLPVCKPTPDRVPDLLIVFWFSNIVAFKDTNYQLALKGLIVINQRVNPLVYKSDGFTRRFSSY